MEDGNTPIGGPQVSSDVSIRSGGSSTVEKKAMILIRSHLGSSYGMPCGPLRFCSHRVDGRTPCGRCPWTIIAPCQLQAALPGLGVAARDLLLSNVLLGKVAKRLQLPDTACSVCRHIAMAYVKSLCDEVDAYCSMYDPPPPPAPTTDISHRATSMTNFNCRLPGI